MKTLHKYWLGRLFTVTGAWMVIFTVLIIVSAFVYNAFGPGPDTRLDEIFSYETVEAAFKVTIGMTILHVFLLDPKLAILKPTPTT